MLYETFRFSAAFEDVTGATDEFIELQKDADGLMNASDYLTQEVQDFTVTTEKIHLINYFEEAEETKRREKSIEKMKDITGEGTAYKFLHNAMNESLDLMQTEYYAMKLITIACEIEYIPDEVEKVELTKQDAALSNSEKIKLAQRMVHDTTYHRKKEVIRTNMESCLVELEKQTHIIQDEANEKLETRLNNIRVIIFIQLAIIIVILIMTSVLVILPMLRGVYSIKKDEKLPVKGAYEFRYLAKTYNSMYEAFKKSIASLNYEASHDKLTGLYNRAGYDVLSRSVDLGTTAVLMIDVDKFKDINDQYGHDVGDKILQKFARVLRKTFRSEDYICRIGGDEFVVFMMHVTDELRDLIILKTKQINSALADASDELPPASASIGIAFGHDAPDMETLLKHADEALYNVKENGRGGGSFYDPGRI
jgi:diguanylate cyclase (GGDEF)-like protein